MCNWRIIVPQGCAGTTMWISHKYTHIPSLLSLPSTLPHLTPLGSHRAPGWPHCFIQQLLSSYLFLFKIIIPDMYWLFSASIVISIVIKEANLLILLDYSVLFSCKFLCYCYFFYNPSLLTLKKWVLFFFLVRKETQASASRKEGKKVDLGKRK